jgi:hypothetical protein
MLTDVLIIVLIIISFVLNVLFIATLGRQVRGLSDRNAELIKSIYDSLALRISSQSNELKQKVSAIPKQPEPNISDNADLYKDPVTKLLSMKAYRANIAKLRNGGDLSVEDINKGD